MEKKQSYNTKKANSKLEQLHTLSAAAMKKSSKLYNQRLITHGVHSAKISDDFKREIDKAAKDGDSNRYLQLISTINYEEGYLSMPDLIFPLGSSIKSLKVSISSTYTEDKQLLHKLLNNS